MGSAASKATRSAAGSSARKYPTRVPNATTTAPPPTQTGAPRATAQATQPQQPTASSTAAAAAPVSGVQEQLNSTSRTEAADPDAASPTFASQLRRLGPVQPRPHFSPSSVSPLDPAPEPLPPSAFPAARNNPAVALLGARKALQEEAEAESTALGRRGFEGRRFLDVGMVKRVLTLRERGEDLGKIEKELGLKKGILEKLGRKGVVGVVGGR